MVLPPGWTDNGAAVYGPVAPDGNRYFFADSSGMRTLALRLFDQGILRANDVPLINARVVDPNRVIQITAYHGLAITRANPTAPWSGWLMNLGAEYVKAQGIVPVVLPIPTPPQTAGTGAVRVIACLGGKGISEFTPGDYVNTGRCNWASLEIALAAVEHRAPSHDAMEQIANDAYARSLCTNINKAARMDQVATYARDVRHKTVLTEWDYSTEPMPHDWAGLFESDAGVHPIIVQVANGSAFVDVETGVRDEAAPHLRYHTVCVVGKKGSNILVGDPDHPQAASRFQVYTPATFAAAVPCGLVMLAA